MAARSVMRSEATLGRIPLGDITVNSPAGDGKNMRHRQQHEPLSSQELGKSSPRHAASLPSHNSIDDLPVDVYNDPETSSHHRQASLCAKQPASNEANDHDSSHAILLSSPSSEDQSRVDKVTFDNLTPHRAVQTTTPQPIINSNPFDLSLAYAHSSSRPMAPSSIRQDTIDAANGTNTAMSAQQGKGEHIISTAASTSQATSASPAALRSKMLANPGKRSFSNKENVEPYNLTIPAPTTPLRNSTTVYDALEAAVVEAASPPLQHSSASSPIDIAVQKGRLAAKSTTRPKAIDTVKPIEKPRAVDQPVSKRVEHSTPVDQPQTIVVPDSLEPEVSTEQSACVVQTEPAVHPIESDLPKIDSLHIDDTPMPVTPIIEHESPLEQPHIETSFMVAAGAKISSSPPRSKKDPGPRPTKASLARISLAHNTQGTPKAPTWGPPRQSTGLRSISNNSASSQRVTSSGSTISDLSTKNEVVIPHSKPRPMSMCFPMPAPLRGSTKTPTRPTFQLPGEVVAQKLKAAREEREKKEEVKKVFKARPVPASTHAAPAVRPTNTSRARESLGLGKDGIIQTALHVRASSVAAVRPTARKSSVSSSRATSSGSDKPSTLGPGVSERLYNPKRASMSLANISKPRLASPYGAPVKTAPPVKAAPVSGREVYQRTLFANEAAERERREKEEATKKARAEAAERSRLLSREWAAKKQRQQQQTCSKTAVQIHVEAA